MAACGTDARVIIVGTATDIAGHAKCPQSTKSAPRRCGATPSATAPSAVPPVDLRDGFIHFSTAAQVGRNRGQAFRRRARSPAAACRCRPPRRALKWEPSRGGALFPHLYGELDLTAVTPRRSAAARPTAGIISRRSTLEAQLHRRGTKVHCTKLSSCRSTRGCRDVPGQTKTGPPSIRPPSAMPPSRRAACRPRCARAAPCAIAARSAAVSCW